MKIPSLFRHIRKSALLLLVLALLGGYSVHNAFSHYDGITIAGYAAFPSGCGQSNPCHSPVPDPTTVIHLYTPATIVAGNTYKFTLSVANPNKEDIAAGFDIDANQPVILDTIPGQNTIITNPDSTGSGEWTISHMTPKSFVGDSATWTFNYTAPTVPGVYTIYIAGNAVNGDSATATDSDRWNHIAPNITVVAPSGVAPAPSMPSIQVYPNPASRELFLNDGVPSDVGSYTLTDASGRVMLIGRQVALDGSHSIDVSTMAAGAYMLTVQPRSRSAFMRSIIIQR